MIKRLLEHGKQTDHSIFADTMVEMTWQEVEKSAEVGAIVLFPIGVVEEHGPHMDLSPDIYMSHLFCRFLKEKLENKNIKSIIAPPYYWGISNDVKMYPGTFSIRPETMKALLIDIFTSLDSWGFSNVFIANAHGDRAHVATIKAALTEAQTTLNIKIYFLADIDIEVENPPVFPLQREGSFQPDYHAGANETAAMNTFFPEKVDTGKAKELKPQDTFHPLGYCGDPGSFELERTVIEFFEADSETDALKIEAVLKRERA